MSKTNRDNSALLPSQVVKSLALLASSGTYTVDPQGSRNMNALFVEVARVINELEADEQADARIPESLDSDIEETEDGN